MEILALDRGPGMANVDRCFEDGYSTAGSPGTGLGALRRLATTLDVYSRPGGTALLVAGRTGGGRGAPTGRTSRSVASAWRSRARSGAGMPGTRSRAADGITVLVVDGLGHGAGAADAARECVHAFRRHAGAAPGGAA